MSDLESLKAEAAQAALGAVESGMKLGLGTGSTIDHFLQALGRALADGRLRDIRGVPTSERTRMRCAELGIALEPLEDLGTLDLAVDGADEVDPNLDLIKGLGGALLREKMVAAEAKRFVVIADQTKDVPALGAKAPLPIEVVPFAWKTHLPFLKNLGLDPVLRLQADGEPLRTDNGNFVIDARALSGSLPNPASLSATLLARPGVVDHGLFIGMCSEVWIATATGVQHRSRPS